MPKTTIIDIAFDLSTVTHLGYTGAHWWASWITLVYGFDVLRLGNRCGLINCARNRLCTNWACESQRGLALIQLMHVKYSHGYLPRG